MRKIYLQLVLVCLFSIALCQNAFAAIMFTAKASTAWGTSTTWTTLPNTPGAVPTASDNVFIPLGFNVTLDATGDVCNTLTMTGGTLTGSTFTLTVGSGGVSITTGTITFTTGTLTTGSGGLSNLGTLTYTGAGSLNCAGNFTNSGTFNYGTSTTTFNGTAAQTIGGTTTTNFYNLIINPSVGVTVTMANNIVIKNNFTISQGTFASSSFSITGNGTGIMTMSAGTNLILGSTTVATAVAFPSNYTANNINLALTSTVIYQANTSQVISGTPNYANLTVTGGTANTDNTLSSNTTIFGNLLIQNGSGTVTFDENGKVVGLHGNVTDNGVFYANGARDSLSATSGVQAISSTETHGITFYYLVVNNSSSTSPGITSTCTINDSDKVTYLAGNLDLKGNNFNITTSSAVTDLFSGGTIISSVAGSNFNITDPDTVLTVHLYGTWIGNQTIGITESVVASQIEFQSFTEYGTASYTKDGDATSNSFGGGNGFHGPVTFTSYRTTGLWKFGVSTTSPDTFYNATLNAGGNATGNDNFIFGANNTETFNGTTTVTSTTPGGVYFGRSNGTGNANIIFNGPVICTISLTGNVTFADADASNVNSCTFNSTIQLNSTASSTGYYYFGNSAYSTITLSSTGQFVGTGSLLGKSNTYLENVTQNGTTLTQTINTAGSTGFLEIGGKTTAPGLPCIFNAPCVFSADTAGYIVSATFNNSLTFNVNHPSANGYMLSSTFNGTTTATIGEMRIQNNTFNGTTTLTETNTVAADSSTTNGGNTFNAPVTIANTGSAFLFFGATASDYFNSDVTFTLNGATTIASGTKFKSYYAGNITLNGTAAFLMSFGYYYGATSGGMVIDGSGTQIMSISGSAIPPGIHNLTMNMTAAGTNIFEFSNFNPVIAGVLTFSTGNTGLINLNGHTMTMGYALDNPTVISTISYPATSSGTAGWIYNGTLIRDIKTGTIGLPTAAAPSTAGFFPMGSSPTLNVFQPFWFSITGAGVTTAGNISVSQTSNANWFTKITAYNDATWAGGTSVLGVSNATWVVTPGGGMVLGTTGKIMFGGFGFQYFVDADVNASLATSTIDTYAAPSNLWGATDVEVERTGLSLADMTGTWHIGTSNVTASPLPIQLTSFSAQCNNYQANLRWTTATETNNNFFTLEKTQDGYNYLKVMDVKGAGTTTSPQEYSVVDESPYSTTSYYRLSQTDIDGQKNILNTIVYSPCENENDINSFSYNHTVKVEINALEAGSYTISLYNTIGQQVISQTINVNQGLNTYSFPGNNLTGVCVVRVIGPNTSYSKKLIVGL